MKKPMTREEAQKLQGKRIRLNKAVVKNGISFKKGSTYTVQRINFGSPIYFYIEGYNNVYFTPSQFDQPILNQKELETLQDDLMKEQKKLGDEISLIQKKIDFITEVGVDKYDEDEFKAYNILITIENGNLSKIEKAQQIAKLVKN